MTNVDIAQQRLHNQHLTAPTFEKPGDVVAWFGAVQAQDYLGSLWAVGLRMQQATEAAIEQAIADGVIVRTHPMRGTWHFVAAVDIRWLLSLMAPRTIASAAGWYRRLELDDTTFAKSNVVFARTLMGGRQLTRKELAAAHEQAGISTADLRMTFLLSRAEAEGLICSGARRGKQFTYALLDELVPPSKTLAREEAVAELVRRYFTSHGPATVQDFVWWSGLTTADARAGLAMVKSHLIQQVIDGQTYWLAPSTPTASVVSPTAYLLPPYDEYTVAYTDRSAVLDPAYAEQTRNGIFSPVMVVDGQIVGTWTRTFKKNSVVLATSLFISLSQTQEQALAAAGQRYSQFIGMAVLSPSEG